MHQSAAKSGPGFIRPRLGHCNRQMKNNIRILAALFLISFGPMVAMNWPIASYAADATPAMMANVVPQFVSTGETSDGWSWTKMDWKADNTPYAALRQRIEKQITESSDPAAVVADYKQKADSDTANPLAEFAYGYAALYFTEDYSAPQEEATIVAWPVPDALARAKFPNTYDYARLRFVMQVQVHLMPELLRAGLRLANLNRNDVHVQTHFVEVLAYCGTEADTDRAIAYATNLISEFPGNADYPLSRGMIYLFRKNGSSQQPYKADGIADLQKYVDLSPSTDTLRPVIIKMIQQLNGTK
jgi:hypothetical protein